MNAYELADQVEMWGEDLLALNMKGGIPVIEGAKMLRHQADYIAQLEKGLESSIALNKAQAERQVKELTDEIIEQVRVAIMGAAYWCADENMPEAYNAVKVCCGQVLGILVKAQEK
jgi:hypothetical protein